MRRIFVTLILALGLLLPAVPAQAALSSGEYESRVRDWVNKYRADYGKKQLAWNSCPDGFAERHIAKLEAEDAMYHQDISKVWETCGGVGAAENLGRGFYTPQELVQAWMNSTGHRGVILNGTYDQIGVGSRLDEDGRWYTSAVFLAK